MLERANKPQTSWYIAMNKTMIKNLVKIELLQYLRTCRTYGLLLQFPLSPISTEVLVTDMRRQNKHM